MPRAPVSRPDTFATGRPERPDPCADPPTVAIRPTRLLPAVPVDGPDDDPDAATVPRLRAVEPAASDVVPPLPRGNGPGDRHLLAVVVVAALLHQVAALTVLPVAGAGPGTLFLVAWQVTTVADLAAVVAAFRPGPVSLRRLLVTTGPVLLLVAVLAAPPLAARGLGSDVAWVLVLGAALRLVTVGCLRPGRGGTTQRARLHLGAAVATLLAVGGTVTVVTLTLAPTAADLTSPATVRAVLLPVAAAFVLVQVACAAAALAARPAARP